MLLLLPLLQCALVHVQQEHPLAHMCTAYTQVHQLLRCTLHTGGEREAGAETSIGTKKILKTCMCA